QALDIILRTKGLSMRRNGSVIYIAPTEEITAREQLELQALQQRTQLEPLRTELIQVNYAKADTLAALLKTAENNLLSERGSVTVDARTNTLLISDVPAKISELRELVTRLDVPVRQVLIDSRVVIARDDFSRELGVRFGASGVADSDDGVAVITGSAGGADTVINSALDNLQSTGQPFPVAVPGLNDRLGVRLGTTSDPFGRLAMAILGEDYLLDLELSALQAEGRGETLSNPRVVTTDRTQAFIKQGREIPYQVISDDGVNIQFKEAKLELIVTPQITPDNRILMDLRINKNEQGQNVSTGTGGAIPSIDTREIETQVLIDNGETIVLGGVFEQITGDDVDRIPYLSDIPGLGKLFQRTAKTNSKLELLIFVTPQIITEELVAR
ncbi:MAG: type IV pilus secretin PilQ, partial [Candidatus Competibacteraceae bacterium]|nr:type IV pilus secretin PilQ [Candidatus Competibacteraceae bacterium]